MIILTMEKRDDYSKAINNINEPHLVCAAAGTGKTKVLVDRYVEILKSGDADIDQIVAITFTEKAANEMKERIREIFNSNILGFSTDKKSLLIEKIGSAPISTVHSFCARILHDNLSSISVDPLFRILDEVEETVLRNDFIEKFLNKELKNDNISILHLLDYLDLSVIRDILNTSWSNRYEWKESFREIKSKTDRELIIEIKKRWQEYTINRLSLFLNDPGVAKSLSNINSLPGADEFDRLQQSFNTIMEAVRNIRSGRIPNSIWDNSLNTALSSRKMGTQKNWGDFLNIAREYHASLSSSWKLVKNDFMQFDEEIEKIHVSVLGSCYTLTSKMIEQYSRELSGSGMIDFSGLEIEAERFLSNGSEEAVSYTQKFKHLLVDEFQDINPIQNRIIQALKKLNPELVVFLVGDEKQSIYRFRGAEVEIFNKEKQKRKPLILDLNFRSIPPLMQFYNQFFKHVLGEKQPSFSFETNYPVAIEPFYKEDTSTVPIEFLIIKSDSEQLGTEDAKVDAGFSPILAEATFVASRIADLNGKLVVKESGKSTRSAEWKDMVILLRYRTHQSVFEAVLQKAGIQFYAISGVGFYDRREVQDVVNFLRVLLNFHDEVALIGTLRSPMFGISDLTLNRLRTEGGLFDGLKRYFKGDNDQKFELDDGEKRILAMFNDVYKELRDRISISSTAEIIRDVLSETNYLSVLVGLDDGKQCIANVRKLMDLAVEWSYPHEISTIDFIRRVQIYRSIQVREGEASLASERGNCVTIMTIHAAKGLDFPIVFVPQLSAGINYKTGRLLFHPEEGVATSLKSVFYDKESFIYSYLKKSHRLRTFAEEKRLLYVAATRARSYLVLSAIDVDNKGKSVDKSLYPLVKSFISGSENDGLYYFREKTLSELYRTYKSMTAEKATVPLTLNEKQRRQIKRMVRPIGIERKLDRITPTEFAEWVVRKSLNGEILVEASNKEDEDLPLEPLELGSLIHKAFSWCDFKNLSAFRKNVQELLRPFFLKDDEQETVISLLESWGQRILEPGNGLNKIISRSVEQEREVEIMGYIDDVLIEGKIDLLIKDCNSEYTIVDFKSDRIDGYPSDDLFLKYRAQLDLYTIVLTCWSKLPVSKHCIYFIRNGLMISTPVTERHIKKVEDQLKEFVECKSQNI